MTGFFWGMVAVAAPELAGVAAVFVGRLCGLNWRHHDDREQPIPGASQAIALTKPAPGHQTGPVAYTITAWQCGCITLRDGDGRITGTYACQAPDLDSELRDLLR